MILGDDWKFMGHIYSNHIIHPRKHVFPSYSHHIPIIFPSLEMGRILASLVGIMIAHN